MFIFKLCAALRLITSSNVVGCMTARSAGCPLYLQKQTFIAAIGMSALGHKQTFAAQSITSSERACNVVAEVCANLIFSEADEVAANPLITKTLNNRWSNPA
jgi:H+/gluconate symporter-like permease